ncbi:MAG TPA: hypothetical protein VM686_35735 [Polyangiaceae bacterium]|jgi:hypothetical protein|nr:hypothetical protein [Polyangiaceae bacterium]
MNALFEFDTWGMLYVWGVLVANVMGYILLGLAMYDAIPRWLRGVPLVTTWFIGLAPFILGLADDGWSLHVFVFSLAPVFGLFIATLAARHQVEP